MNRDVRRERIVAPMPRCVPLMLVLVLPVVAYWQREDATADLATIDAVTAALKQERQQAERVELIPAWHCSLQQSHAIIDGVALPSHHQFVRRGDRWNRVNQRISGLQRLRTDRIDRSGLWLVRLLSSCFAAAVCIIAVSVFRCVTARFHATVLIS